MKFSVITLFPELIENFAGEGLLGQARKKDLLRVECVNPRQYTADLHHTVDDRVFGGGDGMVMKVEPLAAAVTDLRRAGATRVVVLSPQGRVWRQADARSWAEKSEHTVLVCGRYAGIDHRFTVKYADEEISLGDFVLNGGEVAACAMIESVARLLPGVLGNDVSAIHDSFSEGLLECPQFTRPREIDGLNVPSPLLSGHHMKIQEFERAVAILRTATLRPDLVRGKIEGLTKLLAQVAKLPMNELTSLGLTREDLDALREEFG